MLEKGEEEGDNFPGFGGKGMTGMELTGLTGVYIKMGEWAVGWNGPGVVWALGCIKGPDLVCNNNKDQFCNSTKL